MNWRGSIALIGVAALLAAALFLWPTPWGTRTVDGQRVRISRFTGQVQFRRVATGEWETFGDDNRSGVHRAPDGTNPTASELANVRVENVRVLFSLPGSCLRADLVNENKTPLVGEISFHFLIRSPVGTIESERELRGSVDIPAGETRPFEMRTNLNLKPDSDIKMDLRVAPDR